MKRVLFFFLLILSIHFINAQPLSQRLDALLHEEVLKTSEVGIAVFDLTTITKTGIHGIIRLPLSGRETIPSCFC